MVISQSIQDWLQHNAGEAGARASISNSTHTAHILVSGVSAPPKQYTSDTAESTISFWSLSNSSSFFVWQQNFPCSSEILKRTFRGMTLHDEVDKTILAPAVCRFHMKCGVPWRMATASCPHCRLFGSTVVRIAFNGQGSDWWHTEKDERKSYLCYEIFSCAQMSKNTISSIWTEKTMTKENIISSKKCTMSFKNERKLLSTFQWRGAISPPAFNGTAQCEYRHLYWSGILFCSNEKIW